MQTNENQHVNTNFSPFLQGKEVQKLPQQLFAEGITPQTNKQNGKGRSLQPATPTGLSPAHKLQATRGGEQTIEGLNVRQAGWHTHTTHATIEHTPKHAALLSSRELLVGGERAVALFEILLYFLDFQMYDVDDWAAHKWESAMAREQRFRAQATASTIPKQQPPEIKKKGLWITAPNNTHKFSNDSVVTSLKTELWFFDQNLQFGKDDIMVHARSPLGPFYATMRADLADLIVEEGCLNLGDNSTDPPFIQQFQIKPVNQQGWNVQKPIFQADMSVVFFFNLDVEFAGKILVEGELEEPLKRIKDTIYSVYGKPSEAISIDFFQPRSELGYLRNAIKVIIKYNKVNEHKVDRISGDMLSTIKYIPLGLGRRPIYATMPASLCSDFYGVKPCCFRSECVLEGGVCDLRAKAFAASSFDPHRKKAYASFKAEKEKRKREQEEKIMSVEQRQIKVRQEYMKANLCPNFLAGKVNLEYSSSGSGLTTTSVMLTVPQTARRVCKTARWKVLGQVYHVCIQQPGIHVGLQNGGKLPVCKPHLGPHTRIIVSWTRGGILVLCIEKEYACLTNYSVRSKTQKESRTEFSVVMNRVVMKQGRMREQRESMIGKSFSCSTDGDGPELSIATHNIRGLQSFRFNLDRAFNNIIYWMTTKKIQILILQEHNLIPERAYELDQIEKYHNVKIFTSYSQTQHHRGGVMGIISKKHFDRIELGFQDENMLEFKVYREHWKQKIIGIYAPARATQRVDCFNQLRRIIDKESIVLGDWNCVPDVTLDIESHNPLGYANHGAKLLDLLMEEANLWDIRREQLQNEKEFTRVGRNSQNNFIKSRIDRVYAPLESDLLTTFELTNDLLIKDVPSDHCIVTCKWEKRKGKSGKQRKKINEDLLLSTSIQEHIISMIEEIYNTHKYKTDTKKWGILNKAISTFLIRKTKENIKESQNEIKELLLMNSMITYKLTKECNNNRTQQLQQAQQTLTKKIRDIKQAKSVSIGNEKAAYSLHNKQEVCSKEFFSPLRKTGDFWINEIREKDWSADADCISEGGMTADPEKITEEFRKYYEKLFSHKETDANERRHLINKLRTKRIFRKASNLLDKPIEEKEVYEVMCSLPLGKQAGPNRVPNAVYKALARHMAPLFTRVLNEFPERSLPSHFLKGDISVIYKKGDRSQVTNYRPITLLNCDYKIYTRVLARRFKQVVHQFVSEQQKGFTPNSFIAENSMLLKLVEAYINEEPMDRGGILLFLDMEKAFDRVSYDFLLESLEAIGCGSSFQRRIKQLYDYERPPKRRLYINGYYSNEFELKCGVAQGCPLSPLLFLLVAESLNIAIQEEEFQGIKIGKSTFKISQFADDTTILMRSIEDINKVNRALCRWSRATAMRENIAKREGLAMGDQRDREDLPKDVKWAGEGEWVISLGVPIGNEMDEERWYNLKLQSIRSRLKKWTKIYGTGLYGRNLIVQAIFFGSLRYWLFSMHMPDGMRDAIQKEASVMLWSRKYGDERYGDDPTSIRIRRWTNKTTAGLSKEKGGLNILDWKEHVRSFEAQWILRYLRPGRGSWKEVLDHFILEDKRNDVRFPEGRKIVMCNLNTSQKRQILDSFPKKAKYIRRCLKSFWEKKFEQDTDDTSFMEGESLWHNWRFNIEASHEVRQFFKKKLSIVHLSDIFKQGERRLLNRDEWKIRVERQEGERSARINTTYIERKVEDIIRVINQIPREIINSILNPQRIATLDKREVYIMSKREAIPAKYVGSFLRRIWIDNVGIGHLTDKSIRNVKCPIVPALTMRNKRKEYTWVNPITNSFPWSARWKVGSIKIDIQTIDIHKLSQLKPSQIDTQPTYTFSWDMRLNSVIDWEQIWSSKPCYCSPKDTLTFTKLRHRNLWVAQTNPLGEERSCLWCEQDESMLHLAECKIIRETYWTKLLEAARGCDVTVPPITSDLIVLGNERVRNKDRGELLSFINIGWRCLYAEIVSSRITKKEAILERALLRAATTLCSRVLAFGYKWRRWLMSRVNKLRVPSQIPERVRGLRLIEFERGGNFKLKATLAAWHHGLKMRSLQQETHGEMVEG